MKNLVKKITSKTTAIALLSAITVQNAFAELPTMQAPSRGEGAGIMETIKNHAYDAVILGGLLLCVFGFMKVAGSLITSYGEVQDGRKKWGDLGMSALVGAIMLVVIIWLLTEAAKVL
ncbi:TIGR03745 family integrating conjugative element membrane protein [[Pasteurella] aerogenes]